MIIDCDTCIARDVACGDCVIGVLLARPAPPRGRAERSSRTPAFDLDESEAAALGSLADAGLVPPLRLVAPLDGPADRQARPA